jgi:hypothetical protein
MGEVQQHWVCVHVCVLCLFVMVNRVMLLRPSQATFDDLVRAYGVNIVRNVVLRVCYSCVCWLLNRHTTTHALALVATCVLVCVMRFV